MGDLGLPWYEIIERLPNKAYVPCVDLVNEQQFPEFPALGVLHKQALGRRVLRTLLTTMIQETPALI